MQEYSYLLILIVVLPLIFLSFAWQKRRSEALINGWARANGLTIVDKESRTFLRGPMFWTTSKGQTVYRITVRDQYGSQRTGWIRCGGRWMGLHSDKVDVRWD
jgi:hypothetical protein